MELGGRLKRKAGGGGTVSVDFWKVLLIINTM